MDAQQALGYQADLAYNIALCYYRMKQFGPALKHLAEIIERGVREHPELSVGSQTDGMEVKSVGNTPVLKETALIEAFNLKVRERYPFVFVFDNTQCSVVGNRWWVRGLKQTTTTTSSRQLTRVRACVRACV